MPDLTQVPAGVAAVPARPRSTTERLKAADRYLRSAEHELGDLAEGDALRSVKYNIESSRERIASILDLTVD